MTPRGPYLSGMDPEIPLYPFTPWTQEQLTASLAALPGLAAADLLDLAECLSEGLEDLPEAMQGYYRAVRAELASR